LEKNIMELEKLIEKMRDTRGISDIHLIAGVVPHFRRDGELEVHGFPVVTSAEIAEAILPLLPQRMRERFEFGDGTALATVKMAGVTLRVHLFRERGNACATIRRAPDRAPRLKDLGFNEKNMALLLGLITTPTGLVICAGPTGSGKTTLVATLLEEINQLNAARIYIIEEFVEYGFVPVKSVITRQLVGSDTPDFGTALRNVMYSDPDIVMIESTPDLTTFLHALSLAETGHLVFIQSSSNTSSSVIRDLLTAAPETHRADILDRLGNALVAILGQQLIPRNNQPGRVPALEILLGTPGVRQKLRAGQRDFRAEMMAGRDKGMQTMNQALEDMVEADLIAKEVAESRTAGDAQY
jgi:twitching motility protein PilT